MTDDDDFFYIFFRPLKILPIISGNLACGEGCNYGFSRSHICPQKNHFVDPDCEFSMVNYITMLPEICTGHH